MIFILLSILASTCIFVLFKVFALRGVHTLGAIIINYIIAAILGYILAGSQPLEAEIWNRSWIWIALIEGVLFISIFYLIAITSQKVGISTASVATKMSLVIPVVLFMIIKSEDVFTLQKVSGIILACLAVYLVSLKQKGIGLGATKYWYLPLFLFIGSGIIDFLLGYAEEYKITNEQDQLIFIPSIFMITSFLGIFISLGYKKARLASVDLKTIIGGIALGLVNYGSLYCLLKAFNSNYFEKSILYTLNNVGIVGLSAVLSLMLFKEKLSVKNWLGIALAIISIFIIAT